MGTVAASADPFDAVAAGGLGLGHDAAVEGDLRNRIGGRARADWRLGRDVALAVLLAMLAGCAGEAVPPPSAAALAPAPDGSAGRVFLLTHGWHTDIAVPAGEIGGPLRVFVERFPQARNIVFGYGKRSYMTEPEHGLGDWLGGPFPGAGALEVSAIESGPAAAYGAAHITTINLPPGGAERLSAFIWATLRKNAAGEPVEAGPGDFSGSVVYDAASGYSLSHTCNTWSAEALAATGLPVRWQGVIFSRQIDAEAQRVAAPAAAAGNDVAQAAPKPP